MNFPFITDPFFYAVAIPAVFLVGLSKSGFGAGFGSLAVPLMALATRAYVMEEGRIVAQGQASELLTRPEIRKAYLGIEAEK